MNKQFSLAEIEWIWDECTGPADHMIDV